MKCDINKCKARCCYNVMIDRRYLSAYSKKIVTMPKYVYEYAEDKVLPVVSENPDYNRCPFLTESHRCNIYEQRPPLCRIYGTESEKSQFLRCGYLEGGNTCSVTVDRNKEYLNLLKHIKQFKHI